MKAPRAGLEPATYGLLPPLPGKLTVHRSTVQSQEAFPQEMTELPRHIICSNSCPSLRSSGTAVPLSLHFPAGKCTSSRAAALLSRCLLMQASMPQAGFEPATHRSQNHQRVLGNPASPAQWRYFSRLLSQVELLWRQALLGIKNVNKCLLMLRDSPVGNIDACQVAEISNNLLKRGRCIIAN